MKVRPTAEPHDRERDGVVERHPAFGLLRASRVTGRATLFGANFDVDAYVQIELQTAKLDSHLQTEWPFPEKIVATVAMSEAQWATFVSSMNVGSGTPCTIEYGPPAGALLERKPGIEREHGGERRAEHIRRHVAQDLSKIQEAVVALNALADAPGSISKSALRAALSGLTQAVTNAPSNYQFAADMVTEHMGTLAEELKAQIHAHETMVRMGRATEVISVAEQKMREIEVVMTPTRR